MADSVLKIEGIHPTIDGEYPISAAEFNNRDWHDIKRIAGVRMQELSEAFSKGDSDLFVAFACITLRHAGKPVLEDMLWDAAIGKITFIAGDEEEVEDLPPASTPPSEALNEHGGGERQSEPSDSSGASSSNGSDHQASDPSRIGAPALGIGATSGSEMWAS